MDVVNNAKILYEYHRLHQSLEKADIILVLGSHDLRVAERAADLFKQGLASIVVVSGGMAHIGDLLETGWTRTEAEEFSEVMEKAGVPSDKIILEKEAQNTGDNFKLSGKTLTERGIRFSTAIVVTKPYMERRAYATGMIQWSDKRLIVTSPQLDFEQYLKGSIDQDALINIMVGDLQRIIEYPKLGYQIEQDVPTEVLAAYEALIATGYDKHLLASV